MDQTPVKDEKHILILKKIDGLFQAVRDLESLCNKIDPIPQPPTGMVEPSKSPVPSLSLFLNSTPAEIMQLEERINKAVGRIESSIF